MVATIREEVTYILSGMEVLLKKNCVGAGWHAGTNALVKISEVVGKGANPSGAVRDSNQVAILEGLAADRVNDNVCLFISDDV